MQNLLFINEKDCFKIKPKGLMEKKDWREIIDNFRGRRDLIESLTDKSFGENELVRYKLNRYIVLRFKIFLM